MKSIPCRCDSGAPKRERTTALAVPSGSWQGDLESGVEDGMGINTLPFDDSLPGPFGNPYRHVGDVQNGAGACRDLINRPAAGCVRYVLARGGTPGFYYNRFFKVLM
jgi:hypothetical protein